jgi:aconitate hydratase 2/2-methylisocitrate dehydratase
MLEAYRQHVAERAALGIPPLPLNAKQTEQLVELLKNPPKGEEDLLVELITFRVPPGVDDAAKVKASFLAAVAEGSVASPLVSRAKATELLGTMLGGYNVKPLIDLLADAEVGGIAAEGLKKTLLVFDFFHDVQVLAEGGNANAKGVLQSWADAEWFTSRPEVEKKITVTVFKVPGETNTDDLSPAPDAWSRPDIPLHYLAMLKNTRPGAAFVPEEDGKRGPMQFIEDLKKKAIWLPTWATWWYRFFPQVRHQLRGMGYRPGHPVRAEQALWRRHPGRQDCTDLLQHQEDSGSLPIEVDVSALEMGDVIDIYPYDGKIEKNGATVASFQLKSDVLLDEVRAGGRINLIIGRGLTAKAREALGLAPSTCSVCPGPGQFRQGLLAGTEDGWPRLWSAGRPGRASGHLLRTEDDHRGFARHHRPDDPRRAERPGLPGLLRRPGDAVLLPHRRLSEAGGREDAQGTAGLHLHPWRCCAASGRWRDPQLAEPPAAAGYRGYRW